jgi:D-glycero-alpha-D-manno-heptose 1-phosphate guanylyltransferase
MSVPTCIILAGGLGTRLREAVPGLPKCLAPIAGRPFLEIQLELLAAQGIDDFALSLGHLADQVEDEVRRLHTRFAIRTIVEPHPLGTGGAVAYCMESLDLEEALVTNGDTFLSGSLAGMLEPLACAAGEQARLAVVRVADRTRFGGVEIDDAGRVAAFSEKGRQGPGEINAGLYRVRRAALAAQPTSAAFSLETAILPGLAARRALGAARIDGEFIDIGVPDDYLKFHQAMSGRG